MAFIPQLLDCFQKAIFTNMDIMGINRFGTI
ncbi:hypothetical protein T4D_16759 [Trichinella pseudospiralis]|uniref:Uncharacterized protein n=1 Tax=Trichinella pseudospiralis TaxID=6337 RepID=A0A0V1DKB0_TRIPS|nr:hypothetical protein T4D_16759 [Trichinella pseudospiralis]